MTDAGRQICAACGWKKMQSWEAQVVADSSGKFCGNGLRFATKGEAEEYARDLMSRWTAVREWRVVESPDKVTEVADA